MCLVRMGVDTIYLLDYDHIDPSNLNRQILFSSFDVGRSKVEVAAERLKQNHNLRTKILHYHLNAVQNWSTVVEIAKKCTVIFNNIDYGAVFDYAVNSLCKSLGILYLSGSTYANSIEINLYSGELNDPCWSCNNNTNDSFRYSDEELENVTEIFQFLKDKSFICGEKSRLILEECIHQLEMKSKYSSELMLLYQKKVLHLLLPEYIQNYSSIEFIPKDRSIPTRSVGSWIGVCVSGSCLIVNTWIQFLMKKKQNNQNENDSFHNWIQLNISMFDGSYQTVGYSIKQDQICPICSNIKQITK